MLVSLCTNSASRAVKDQLHRKLLQYFQADENISIASTTIEIVGFPTLQVDQRNK